MKSQSSMPTPTVSARSAQSVAVAADSSTEGRGPSAPMDRDKALAGASGSSVTKNSSVPVTNAAPEHPVAPAPPAPLAPPAPPTFVPPAPIPTVPLGPPGYFWCAVEGCRFELSGINDVAYGIDGRFLFLYKQTGTILFSPITFGGDPASGYHKAGFYKPALGK